jgi:Cu2+-exporting ATPase
MKESGFCCAGCSYVWRLIHEHGLDGYYRIKDAVTPPADAVFQPRDFSWLETAQREAEQTAGPRPPELTLDVQGISCAGCVWLIERVFLQQPGARDIQANAQLGQMRVRWIPQKFSAVAFAQKLQAFGYLAGPAGAASTEGESRGLLRRVGLCAAFAMNIMLFAFPAYFGMERTFEYAPLFNLLALAFGTLSFLVGGMYFIGRALRALREGAMHIDLPISIGILGAYLGSLYGWLAGEERFVYFDFVGTFILLMLIGRWAQVAAVERNQRQLLRQQPKPRRVRLPAGGDLPPEELRAGVEFCLAAGQTVPVEARLESSGAVFSLASINGEAAPRAFRAGGRVPSGAVSVARSEARLTALQSWPESLLAQLLRPAERAGERQRFLEKIIRGYLTGIIAVAVLSGLGWWLATHDALRTWSVVTAVLVVSCPCAIGLAFPLADEMATVALRRRGVFVRAGDLWAKLGRVRKLVFDKTGTLTLETPVLQNPESLRALDATARAALLALVRDNPHPVSQCLFENLLAAGAGEALAGEVRETVGSGVELAPWSLGRPGWRTPPPEKCHPMGDTFAAATAVEFAREGEVLARFQFSDTARPDARAELAALAGSGFQTFILSGDAPSKVAALAAELGLSPACAHGGLSPAEKAAWLETHAADDALMLGDGANDSLAFDRALCRGTPVIHRGVLEQKADFYYLGRGIGGLRALFRVNAIRQRTQTAILIFSVAYNLLAVGLAVAGWMNPLVAAGLMPVNSLITLGLVTGGMRPAFRG